MTYKHQEVEKKWQDIWEKEKTFKVDLSSSKPKYYVLDMFPYPSGSGLHVGHPEGYTATDIIARYKRMKNFEVLHPIGYDSFGLPAEQYAISTGNSPRLFTTQNIENFTKQLKSLGFSFNWEKKMVTSEPYYYKHTQWIFAQLFKKGLTEIKEIEVNWCEELNTVLSNEEVLFDSKGNMVSERGSFPVIKKPMKQWVLKITKYAERLFEGLETLNWPTNIIKLQKNWIYNEGDPKKGLHMRDWVFARQRYWGEPFPIVHQENGEIYLIPESNYPIELPELANYSFSKDGKPALSKLDAWIKYEKDGIKGTRDLNTMPQWAASSWYYIAYLLKGINSKGEDFILDLNSPEAKKIINKWLPVDLYVGGQEHAVLHLLYARFWHLFLYDIGIVTSLEPFQKLYNQGMILGEDGEKMSKSRGNTISPDKIIEEYGADALRLYEMFMGPLSDDKAWSMKSIKGIRSWIDRVFNLTNKLTFVEEATFEEKVNFNKFINSATQNIESMKFNNVVSDMMVFVNYLYKELKITKKSFMGFIQVLSTFAPHLSEEIWSKLNTELNLSYAYWPLAYDVEEVIVRNLAIQINGKFKMMLTNTNLFEDELDFSTTNINFENELFLNLMKNLKLNLSSIKKVIYVKDKILNILI